MTGTRAASRAGSRAPSPGRHPATSATEQTAVDTASVLRDNPLAVTAGDSAAAVHSEAVTVGTLTEALRQLTTGAPSGRVPTCLPDRDLRPRTLFSGATPTELAPFLFRVKEWLRSSHGLPQAALITYVSTCLTGKAFDAYRGWSDQGLLPETVEGFYELLTSQFGDPNADRTTLAAYDKLYQGSTTVSAYAADLRALLATPVLAAMPVNLQIHKFCSRLNADIRKDINRMEFITLDEAVAAAHRSEQLLGGSGRQRAGFRAIAFKGKGKNQSSPGKGAGGSSNPAPANQPQSASTGAAAAGTAAAVVPGTDGKAYPSVECHYCHQLGHYKHKCPKRPPGNSPA